MDCRMLLSLCCLAVSLGAQPPVQEKPVTSCFPAATNAVIRVDAAGLFEDRLFLDFLDRKVGGKIEFFREFRTWTGIDLGTLKAGWVGVIRENQAVIVLDGTFDIPTVQAAVLNIDTVQVVQRPSIPLAIMLPDDKRPGQSNLVAVLDESTLVFGPPDLADAFLAALKGKGEGLPPARAALCASLAGDASLISAAVFGLDEAVFRKAPWLRLFTYGRIQIDSADAQVAANLLLGLRKPEMRAPAAKLIEGARDLYGMLDEDLRKLDPMQAMILEGMVVKPDDKALAVELRLPRETVERMLRPKLGLQ